MEIVVIASQDSTYLEEIECEMVLALAKPCAVEFITTSEYWQQFWNQCPNVVLVVSDGTFATPESYKGETCKLEEWRMCKCFQREAPEIINTQLISVYSAGGGCGRTSAAICIANYLAEYGKSVLYISTETIQDHAKWMGSEKYLADEVGYQIAGESMQGIDAIVNAIEKEQIDYIPSFRHPLMAYHIEFSHLQNIILKIKDMSRYNYVVIELSSEVTVDKMNFLCTSENAVYITTPEKTATYKLHKLLERLPSNGKKRFLVLNRVKDNKDNNLIKEEFAQLFDEYEVIKETDEAWSLESCLNRRLFMETAERIVRGGNQ